MLKPPHQIVEDLGGIFLALAGQMQINRGGFQLGMAQPSLNDPNVDALLQQVGGIGMANMPSSAYSPLCRVPNYAESMI